MREKKIMSKSPDQFRDKPIEPNRLPHEIAAALLAMEVPPIHPEHAIALSLGECLASLAENEDKADGLADVLSAGNVDKMKEMGRQSRALKEALERVSSGSLDPKDRDALVKGRSLVQSWIEETSLAAEASKDALRDPGEMFNLANVSEDDARSESSAHYYASMKRAGKLKAIGEELGTLIASLGQSRGKG